MAKILYIASDENWEALAVRDTLEAAGYEVYDVGSVEESRFALFNALKSPNLVIYHEYAGDDFDPEGDIRILRDNNWSVGPLLVITDKTADEFFDNLDEDLSEQNVDFLFKDQANSESLVKLVNELLNNK